MRSYTLNRLGEHFADYLAETMAADAEAVAATEPAAAPDANSAADAGPAFLIDLARLEWLFGEVFDGPGAEKSALLDPEQLSRIDPQQWAAARLTPVPCLRLVELNWPVQEYYRALRESADVPPPRPGHTRLAVTRRDYVVRHYPLDRTQFELLAAIMAGQTIGEAVASAVELGEFEPDELAARLRDWFRFWAAEGFFLAVR